MSDKRSDKRTAVSDKTAMSDNKAAMSKKRNEDSHE